MSTYQFANHDGSIVTEEYDETNRLTSEQVLNSLQAAFRLFPYTVQIEKVETFENVLHVKYPNEDGVGEIFICGKGTTPGGRQGLSDEQRIQPLAKDLNYVADQKEEGKTGVFLGVYLRDGQTIFCAWKVVKSTASEGTPISKQIKITTIAKAIKEGFVRKKRGSGEYVCAFKPEFLYFYLRNCNWLHTGTVDELTDHSSTETDNINPKEQKERFRNWAEKQLKTNGEPYSPNTISTYISTMETCYSQFKKYKNYDSVFQIQNPKELSEYINAVFDDPGFYDFNKNHASNQSCSRGLQMYQQFVNENPILLDLMSTDKVVDPKEQKERFCNWAEKQQKTNGEPYSPNTITTRISAIESCYAHFKEYMEWDSIFQIQNPKELSEYINSVSQDPDFDDYDKNHTYHCSEGLQMYQQFVNENGCVLGKLCFETSLQTSKSRNRIIFGAPGTGKSFTLDKERMELLGEENETDYERVTFHPDYSYANFVGTYKPTPCKDDNGNNTITYAYVPGPFMRVYVKALKNGRTENPKPFLLIIEEINRANVAAVFGDVFQLLDRGNNGVSEYPIEASEDIKKYLLSELDGELDDYSKILIPNNMFIWATMNSADQGVFPMDTAFKRRWDFTYLGIDANDERIRNKFVVLAKDHPQKVEWNKLRKAINHFLAKENINEDKQLGPYFISGDIVLPEDGDEINQHKFVQIFKNKVIMYLFEDAAKQKRSELFKGCGENNTRYSEICEKFEKNGIAIFCQDIQQEAEPIQIEDAVADDTERAEDVTE